jgi:hypothetical protein
MAAMAQANQRGTMVLLCGHTNAEQAARLQAQGFRVGVLLLACCGARAPSFD